MKMRVRKVRPSAKLPQYQTEHSAGMDFYACIEAPITLGFMERAVIPTGVAVAIPEGYELQIRARSGLAAKHGVTMVVGVGTIDADYRNEMAVILINTDQEPFVVEPDMRIAQMVVSKYEHVEWQEVDELDETGRQGGFGSTGL